MHQLGLPQRVPSQARRASLAKPDTLFTHPYVCVYACVCASTCVHVRTCVFVRVLMPVRTCQCASVVINAINVMNAIKAAGRTGDTRTFTDAGMSQHHNHNTPHNFSSRPLLLKQGCRINWGHTHLHRRRVFPAS
jgi:hypothetical protein